MVRVAVQIVDRQRAGAGEYWKGHIEQPAFKATEESAAPWTTLGYHVGHPYASYTSAYVRNVGRE